MLLQANQRMAIKDFFTPVVCRLCFDKLNVFADVVFCDPHGVKDIDLVGGETVVLARTEMGVEIVSSAKDANAVVLRHTSMKTVVKGQKVDRKRQKWAGYTKAWQEMGHTPPGYPFSLDNNQIESSRYRKQLEQGLALDKFASSEKLLAVAEKWFFRQEIIKRILWPLTRAKGIWRRLKMGGNR